MYPDIADAPRGIAGRAPWRVESGSARRGDAHCDFASRRVRVPLGSSQRERAVRAHEMGHIRLSPADLDPSMWPDIPLRALECAEELRVNHYLDRLGLPVDALHDGSEAASAEQLAAEGEWAELVFFYGAVLKTGAEGDYLRAVRRTDRDAATSLRAVALELEGFLRAVSTDDLASISESELHGAPRGYVTVTIPLARMLARAAGASPAHNRDELRRLRRSLHPGSRRAPSGRFAPLRLATDLEYRPRGVVASSRRARRVNSGRHARFPQALLTDPQRRVFAERRRSPGDVVLIDQSGSMDLSDEAIDTFLAVSPAATIIGYSHRPGDITGSPNAWVIADRRGRCQSIPSGNIGNGVDGPALRFALSQRQSGDRVLWVTDGQITDSADHPSSELAAECADLVRRHKVVVRPTLDAAVSALKSREMGNNPAELGRLGRQWGPL